MDTKDCSLCINSDKTCYHGNDLPFLVEATSTCLFFTNNKYNSDDPRYYKLLGGHFILSTRNPFMRLEVIASCLEMIKLLSNIVRVGNCCGFIHWWPNSKYDRHF